MEKKEATPKIGDWEVKVLVWQRQAIGDKKSAIIRYFEAHAGEDGYPAFTPDRATISGICDELATLRPGLVLKLPPEVQEYALKLNPHLKTSLILQPIDSRKTLTVEETTIGEEKIPGVAQRPEKELNPMLTEEQKKHLDNLRDTMALSAIKKYIEVIKSKYTEVENADTPWQLGLSKSNDILPEAIPWLMELQVYRKLYYSKPITVREARWFSRLSCFRETFSDLSDFLTEREATNEKLRNSFLSHVIATWAKLYAYREILDTIAGIEKPDYSDLDRSIVTKSLKALDKYNNKWVEITIKRIANGVEITREDQKKFNIRYMMSSNIDNVRSREIYFLAHSLGDPEMSNGAVDLYSNGLNSALLDFDNLNKRILKLPYVLRIRFLVYLRQWANEHPDELKSSIEPVIGQIMEKVEKSSHSEIDST